ncbi:FecR family protein [Sphingopyxis sp. Root1497]|uniref:FecR family protein n=1 Tax=Sphingopyxis sp. Root1497 TaxID=1736474 RepID=UPI0009E70129|nr:FecR domain-containing protein [Sphingopyxis sp. Root1497]
MTGRDTRTRGGLPASSRTRLAIAATIAVGGLLAIAWYIVSDRQEPQAAAPLTIDTVVTAPAVLTGGTFKLPDGSGVTLTDGAVLENKFDDQQRRVLLFGGHARFDVAHDAGRPFIVLGAGSRTTALGTIFEVDLRNSRPRVSLIEGAIEVASRNSDRSVRLQPGETAEVVTSDVRILPSMRSAAGPVAIDADRMPLGDVVARANTVNAVKIRLTEPALETIEVSGRFDLADPAALARELAAKLDLGVEIRADAIIIGPAPKKPGR